MDAVYSFPVESEKLRLFLCHITFCWQRVQHYLLYSVPIFVTIAPSIIKLSYSVVSPLATHTQNCLTKSY